MQHLKKKCQDVASQILSTHTDKHLVLDNVCKDLKKSRPRKCMSNLKMKKENTTEKLNK